MEEGRLETDILRKCTECIFYNYEDQGQISFYMDDSNLCEFIIFENGITHYATKETVKQVQEKLNSKGYNCGNPDGFEGEKTRKAVKKYQEDNGLFPSGLIDDSILKSLEP